MILKIKCTDAVKQLYLDTYQALSKNSHKHYVVYKSSIDLSRDDDAGFDLIVVNETVVPPYSEINSCVKLSHEMSAELLDEEGYNSHYLIVPRSSIINTPLIQQNSMGIIDKGYRGNLVLPVVNISNSAYTVNAGTRLSQIIAPGLKKIRAVNFVEELSPSYRGTKGFGSTNAVFR